MDREELLRVILAGDAELDRALQLAKAQHLKALRKYSANGKVNDVARLNKANDKIAATLAVSIAAIITAYSIEGTERGMKSAKPALLKKFKNTPYAKQESANLDKKIANAKKDIKKEIMYRKFPGTNKGPTERIKTVQAGHTRTVRNIIAQGQKRGLGVFEIAKMIEAYVLPTTNSKRVSPWTLARRELNKPISYVPKGIPAGSISYNAYRIVRTETAFTYQQASMRYDDLWYVIGHYWKLSPAHKGKDICDVYARHNEGLGRGVWKKVPTIPHPHDLCTTGPVTMDDDTFAKELKRRYS